MGRPGVDPYREPLPNEALITFDSLFDGVKLPRFTDEEMKAEAAKLVGEHIIAKKLNEDEKEPQIKSWYEKRVVFLGREIRMGVLDEEVAEDVRRFVEEGFSQEFEDVVTGTIEGEIVKEPPKMIEGPKTDA
jgi:hypothetical protein